MNLNQRFPVKHFTGLASTSPELEVTAGSGKPARLEILEPEGATMDHGVPVVFPIEEGGDPAQASFETVLCRGVRDPCVSPLLPQRQTLDRVELERYEQGRRYTFKGAIEIDQPDGRT